MVLPNQTNEKLIFSMKCCIRNKCVSRDAIILEISDRTGVGPGSMHLTVVSWRPGSVFARLIPIQYDLLSYALGKHKSN